LLLPPKEILHDMIQFAATSQIKLLLPGENTDSKALQEMQSETQHLVD